MSSKTVVTFAVVLSTWVGMVNLGCSPSSPTTQPAATANNSATPSVTPASSTTQPAVTAASDDPFHIAKPTADVEGAPAPQKTPSPEAIVTNKKTCPVCGTPNAVNATQCIKCGHKFE